MVTNIGGECTDQLSVFIYFVASHGGNSDVYTLITQDTFHQAHALLAGTLKAACTTLGRKANMWPWSPHGTGRASFLGSLVDHRCRQEDARRFQADLRYPLAAWLWSTWNYVQGVRDWSGAGKETGFGGLVSSFYVSVLSITWSVWEKTLQFQFQHSFARARWTGRECWTGSSSQQLVFNLYYLVQWKHRFCRRAWGSRRCGRYRACSRSCPVTPPSEPKPWEVLPRVRWTSVQRFTVMVLRIRPSSWEVGVSAGAPPSARWPDAGNRSPRASNSLPAAGWLFCWCWGCGSQRLTARHCAAQGPPPGGGLFRGSHSRCPRVSSTAGNRGQQGEHGVARPLTAFKRHGSRSRGLLGPRGDEGDRRRSHHRFV